MESLFSERLEQAAALFTAAAGDERLWTRLQIVAEASVDCLRRDGRIFICGNGGSASQATHLAGELVGPFMDRARRAFAAIPLGFDPASLTACANDFGFEAAYARQLEGLGREGDILWALTTSGNSPNIVAAIERARKLSITSVLFANHDGGRCRDLADHLLTTPAPGANAGETSSGADLSPGSDSGAGVSPASTPRVQELHLLYGHCLCEWIEKELAGDEQEA